MSLPTSGRTGIPQTDGAMDEEARPDMTTMELDALIARKILRHNDGKVEPPELDTSSLQLQLSATNSVGTPLSLESLPEEVQALVRDMRTRQRAAPRERKGKGKAKRIPQLDGDDDEEGEDDEDDINSDLDDSDEDDNDVEGGEEMDHIILCLYDKVTRTKNKWKCVLKDGIMLVNGRDYLFHRANGDFEW
ncbi:transcription factor IIA, alpha/beta subunit-domain-containing protein [Jimgerdemannia flammicorona]|uniref:Transcription factor IIA, alpha/beta subunit-domain-containing protein n=1 Tax=Jimgerdemannia flammicorona TaxID=994334 RepID=A0A433D352_9FUNG|nr:transcription factor IIA, alpha/beta subunit-domain-containing protein [Jimgerdemannia flammicorona]